MTPFAARQARGVVGHHVGITKHTKCHEKLAEVSWHSWPFAAFVVQTKLEEQRAGTDAQRQQSPLAPSGSQPDPQQRKEEQSWKSPG
jgi:hypothetical protein